MEFERGKIERNEPVRSGKYDNFLAPLLLFLLIAVLYTNSLSVPMVVDDHFFIEQNESIRNLGDISAIWSYNPARFFAFLSLAVNYHFGGLNVFGYHIFNIFIHFLGSWTLFWFVKLLLSTGRENLFSSGSRLTRLFPFFVSMIFAAHPLNTQAVTYIWQRNTSLVTLFYLLAMALYLKFALAEKLDESPRKMRWLLLVGAFIASIFATLTKQNAATLLIAVLLLDYSFISGSFEGLKARAKLLAIFFPALFVITVLTMVGGNLELKHIGQADQILLWYEYLATQFEVIFSVYLKLIFFPIGQNLDYDFQPVTSFMDVWIPVVFLLSLLVASILFFNKYRLASFGFLFFTLAMSVESSFFPLEDLVFEHRMYLPSTGLFISVSAILFMLVAKLFRPKAAFVTLFLILISLVFLLSTLTIKRNEVWQTRESLWLDVISKSPKKTRGYVFLGQEYLSQNRLDDVKEVSKKALLADPSSGRAIYLLGLVASKENDNDEAIRLLKEALVKTPELYTAHYALGDLYRGRKLYKKAARSYNMGLYIENKQNIVALMALAESQSYAGLYENAISTYIYLLKLTPENKTILHNLSILYDRIGEKKKSLFYKKEAKGYAPPNASR